MSISLRRIIKNGTSLAVVIPRPILRALDLRRGDLLGFSIVDGRLVAVKMDEDRLLAAGSRVPAPPRDSGD